MGQTDGMEDDMDTTILLKEAEQLKAAITADRRTLHQNPEAGPDLPETAAYVKRRLEEMGYAPRDLYCTLCDTIAWMRQTQKPAKRPVPQSGRSLNAAET